MNEINNLDVVVLLQSLPEHGLERGMSGTVMEAFEGNVYEVEFSDEQGRTFALIPLPADKLLRLIPVPAMTDEYLAQQTV